MQNIKQDLLFLKQKIEEIKIAHFKAETNSILLLPNNIISTLKVDEQGYIWFFTACKRPYTEYRDEELYVSLNYYRKENNSRLLINGKAFIETECSEFPKLNSQDKIILLRVKIVQAEYHKNRASSSFKEKIRSAINYITAGNSHKLYDFSS